MLDDDLSHSLAAGCDDAVKATLLHLNFLHPRTHRDAPRISAALFGFDIPATDTLQAGNLRAMKPVNVFVQDSSR